MAAISDNKFEVYGWIIKVVNSCETAIHLVRVSRLIRSFYNIHRDSFLRQCLDNYKDIKWREIIEKTKNKLNLDRLFEIFLNHSNGDSNILMNKGKFIYYLLHDDEFYEKWGEDCCEKLTEEERYNIWFNNNYETGMERHFDPNNLPDYENEYYYEPTPKRKLKE